MKTSNVSCTFISKTSRTNIFYIRKTEREKSKYLNNSIGEACDGDGNKADNDTSKDVRNLAAVEIVESLEVHAGLHHGGVQLLGLGARVTILGN